MKKFIIALILILSFVTFSIAQEEPIQESQTEEEMFSLARAMLNSSVSIFSIGNTDIGFCTGVVLKNDNDLAYILTAKHCIGAYEEVYVEEAKVFYNMVSIDDDLALLITNKKIEGKVPVVMAEKNAKWGDIVIDFGFPNLDPYIAVGMMRMRTFDHQYARLTVIPGCSGGGIFNLDGELVGIVWASIGTKLAVLEPISDVKIFLKSIGFYNEK